MPEKRLLWHPRQENKFVVGGGSDITLYEWAPAQSEIKHITSQHGLQFMKVCGILRRAVFFKLTDVYMSVLCVVSRPVVRRFDGHWTDHGTG